MRRLLPFVVASLLLAPPLLRAADALRLHPDNPRYFLFRGQPTLLITSAEHYGAVLNADFDFEKYLATLGAARLNNTRLFTGAAYFEPQGAFNIARNTLAPDSGRFLAPWARSDQPGFAGGGHRFDLDRWNPAYFERLHGFVKTASRHGVVVEVNLFCPFYEEVQWRLSPFHPENNVNGAGRGVARTNVYTLDRHGGLLAFQERFVRKVVEELRPYDNVYYEICNEPYFGGVTLPWQHRIADLVVEAQKEHPASSRKLISQNIANGSARVTQPHPSVSILNFHYAAPPHAVAENLGLQRVIGDNETGFRGTQDAPYRMEAWDFIIAGGGLFNHLDYSFTVGHEDGTFAYPPSQPGGGNPGFRRQLGILRDFIQRFDFLRMAPAPDVLAPSSLPAGVSARALAKPGEQYAVYVRTAPLPGQFSARWSGTLRPPKSGKFQLHTISNDGVRLWIDDRLVIDNWTEHATTEDSASLDLDAGRDHRLRLEYFYAGGQAVMKLLWSGPDLPKSVVPPSALRTDAGSSGLRAEYFADKTLSARTRDVVEPGIQFEAADGSAGQFRFQDRQLTLRASLPAGRYSVAWTDTKTGDLLRLDLRDSTGPEQPIALPAPAFTDDLALTLLRL